MHGILIEIKHPERIKYFEKVSDLKKMFHSYLPNDTKNSPNTQLTARIVPKISKEKQINDGRYPA